MYYNIAKWVNFKSKIIAINNLNIFYRIDKPAISNSYKIKTIDKFLSKQCKFRG